MAHRHFPHDSGAEQENAVWRRYRLAVLAVAAVLMLCGGSLVACAGQNIPAPSTFTTSGVPSSTAAPTTVTGPTVTRSLPSSSKPLTPSASCPKPTHAVPVGVYCSSGQLVEQCPDGEIVPFDPGCPGAGGAMRCPDGTIITTEVACPGEVIPSGRPCGDGSSVPEGELCPGEEPVQCPDGSTVPWDEMCPSPSPEPETRTTDPAPPPSSDTVSTGAAPSPPASLDPQTIESGS
jgi:hypothetical protein